MGVSLTSSSLVKDDLIAASAKWVDQAVMIDNNLITGSGASMLEELVSEFTVKVSDYEKEAIEAA